MKRQQDAEVGDWYYYCCEHDLYQVTSEEDLVDVRRDDVIEYKVFETKIEAIVHLMEEGNDLESQGDQDER